VTGRIDKVQPVLFPVRRRPGNCHSLAFDRNAPFPLNVHIVEDLILEVAIVDKVTFLDKPVGQGRFAVIDVGDNTKVTNEGRICHRTSITKERRLGLLLSVLRENSDDDDNALYQAVEERGNLGHNQHRIDDPQHEDTEEGPDDLSPAARTNLPVYVLREFQP
jgi:hypothetical protein